MSENSPSSRVEIGLLVLRSDDMHRLAAFYGGLGLTFVKHSHAPCGEHYSTVEAACVFEICQRKEGQLPTTEVFFGLNVPSVDLAVESVIACKGTVVRSAENTECGRTAIIEDLDGHRAMLIERR